MSNFKSKGRNVGGKLLLALCQGWTSTPTSQHFWVIQGTLSPAPEKASYRPKVCSFSPSSSGWSRHVSVYFWFLRTLQALLETVIEFPVEKKLIFLIWKKPTNLLCEIMTTHQNYLMNSGFLSHASQTSAAGTDDKWITLIIDCCLQYRPAQRGRHILSHPLTDGSGETQKLLGFALDLRETCSPGGSHGMHPCPDSSSRLHSPCPPGPNAHSSVNLRSYPWVPNSFPVSHAKGAKPAVGTVFGE